jgi:short-subunit dehydrogenase
MSSLSGFQGSAFVSTYAASKAFNTVLGESLWAELRHHGVDVLVCAAGATSTPTFDRQTPADKRKLVFPMLPEDVVRSALAHLDRGPVHVPGALNRLVASCGRLLGRRRAVELVSRTTRKMFG